ncbi:hypothetical protein P171DRAFT_473319 [Karstenula rhodostoma CBS 690.94]|uniref:Uncharacterized protein n=1 Tax=Karstenula rhodostoma CBS 690.94 TaxID=1392251 RepID=A0A9P4PJM9_9PLEO|nr:hypothetical protein P171DRAFT_473319 [Karstenula rhodostoma CBS 690.94]
MFRQRPPTNRSSTVIPSPKQYWSSVPNISAHRKHSIPSPDTPDTPASPLRQRSPTFKTAPTSTYYLRREIQELAERCNVLAKAAEDACYLFQNDVMALQGLLDRRFDAVDRAVATLDGRFGRLAGLAGRVTGADQSIGRIGDRPRATADRRRKQERLERIVFALLLFNLVLLVLLMKWTCSYTISRYFVVKYHSETVESRGPLPTHSIGSFVAFLRGPTNGRINPDMDMMSRRSDGDDGVRIAISGVSKHSICCALYIVCHEAYLIAKHVLTWRLCQDM